MSRSSLGGGIKPVSSNKSNAAPIAGRRSVASTSNKSGAAPGGRGLTKGAKDTRSAPVIKEQAISASHLLALLGAGANDDLKGMFSAQDDRSKPVSNPKVYEFQPVQARHGRRAGAGGAGAGEVEDIITGIKKAGIQPKQQPQQQQQPIQQYSDPPMNYDHGQHPQQQQYYNQNNFNQPPPSNYSHQPSSSYPNYDSSMPPPPLAPIDFHAPAVAAAAPFSPVAKNRARAMGSTIFNQQTQADDLPSNTITGHFRGRQQAAPPVQQNQPGKQMNSFGGPGSVSMNPQSQPQSAYGADVGPYSSYINNSSMMSKEPQTRRPAPMMNTFQPQMAYDEQKSNQPNHYNPPFHGGPVDPYSRQSQHQNPYDTRDPSIFTQRGQQLYGQQQPPQSSASQYRPPPTGRDGQYYVGGLSQPPSPQRHQQHQQLQPSLDFGSNPMYDMNGYPTSGPYDPTYRAPPPPPMGSSPPHSPGHLPRHSWGGGDVSQFEAGSIGAREEQRRKQEEMRLVLDQQIKEKQAAGGGGGGGSKSTKYALRHRERQAELEREQQKAAAAAAAQNGFRPESPNQMNYQQQQQLQQQPNYYPPPLQQLPSFPHPQQPPNNGYGQQQQPPPQPEFQSPSQSAHARVRSDLHAGAYEASEGMPEKLRAQHEFRAHLAEQVREKEQKKLEAKRWKEEEDRVERLRLGIAPLPQHAEQQQQLQMQQQQQQYGMMNPNQTPSQFSQHMLPQQQQQLFHHQSQPQLSNNPLYINPHSPTHAIPSSNVGSPSKVAENRGRQMSSNIFSSDSVLSDAEKKARERAAAQAVFHEQVEARRRAKQEQDAAEAEKDRKDNERVKKEQLEMMFRFQGLDPAAAAEKAQQSMEEARRKELGIHAPPPPPSQLQQPGGYNQPGIVSPSNAKTQLAPGMQQQQQQQYPGPQPQQPPRFQSEFVDDGFDEGGENEENIAKLTALTSAMNKKVENRRAKAQEFEDSGLIDESNAGSERQHRGRGRKHHGGDENNVNLDEYEEVPRKVNGVAVAGRRGGKQGPSNSKSAKKGSGAGAAKLKPQPQQQPGGRSQSRGSGRGERPGASATSKKKPSAAQRDRDREAEVLAAVEKRKASILARARREAEEAEYEEQDEDEQSRRSRRSSAAASRKKSTKSSGGNAAAGRKPRISSASVSSNGISSVSRRYGGNVDDDDDLDVEVEPYEERQQQPDSQRDYSPSHHQHQPSRIPYPRAQSGKKRKVVSAQPDYGQPKQENYSPTHQYRASDFTGYGNQQQQQARSSKQPQKYPNGGRGHQQQQQVNVNEYPWFAQAAAAGSALDASLSGNSAFILLPSTSSHHHQQPSEDNTHVSAVSSRAPSSLHQRPYTSHADDDGIAPDELDKLLSQHGQTAVGLDSVFDTNLIPGQSPAPIIASARNRQSSASMNRQPTAGGQAAAAVSNRGSRVGLPSSHGASNSRPISQAGMIPSRNSQNQHTHVAVEQQQPPQDQYEQDQDQQYADESYSEPPPPISTEPNFPLSPNDGGESLEAASQEWLAGSIISPQNQPPHPQPTPSNFESSSAEPERALSPGTTTSHQATPSEAGSANWHQATITSSHSRSSLHGRPQPRVVDPFSKLTPTTNESPMGES